MEKKDIQIIVFRYQLSNKITVKNDKEISMRKLISIFFLLIIMVTGCDLNLTSSEISKESKVISNPSEKQLNEYSNEFIKIYSPKPFEMISSLKFSLTGKILKPNIEYFFYHVEDGHSYLSTGMVETNHDGTFHTDIEISNPTNSTGAIIFYSDSDNDKTFNIEENVNEEFGSMIINFSPSIEVPLSE